MQTFISSIGIAGCLFIGTLLLLILIAFIRLRKFPRNYPKLLIIEYSKIIENMWTLGLHTRSIYFVPFSSNPKIGIRDWEQGTLCLIDRNLPIKPGDFIVYSVRNRKYPAVLWILEIKDDLITTAFIGVWTHAVDTLTV